MDDPTDVGESWVAALSRYHTATTPLPPSPGKGWDESAFVTSRPKLVAPRTQAHLSATRAQRPPAPPAAQRASQQYERARDSSRTPSRERTSWLAGLFRPHEGSTVRRLSKRLSLPLVGAPPARTAARATSSGTGRTASTQRLRPMVVLSPSADHPSSWGPDAETNDDADVSTHTVIDTQDVPAHEPAMHHGAQNEHNADTGLDAHRPPAHAGGGLTEVTAPAAWEPPRAFAPADQPASKAPAAWDAEQPSYPPPAASSTETTGLAPALSYLHIPVVPWPTYLSHDTSSHRERAAPHAYAPPEMPVRRTDASVRAQRHWSMPTSRSDALFRPADTLPQLAPAIGAVAGRAASPFLPARLLAPAPGAPRAVSTPVHPAPQRSASGAFKWRAPGSITARRRSQPLPPLRPPPECELPPIPDVPDTSGPLPVSARSGNEAFGFAL
ncbi:hypothetical protein MBRA1_000044 [Malassezia brasiliensis]|uniref:Uncharacterized protein n=1 Tax=Malassezia brasiliensis TaxID=1821822 RepID=A0AAF0DP42_9BASI|nr:hypothetical protein MBRA1_000044 [Malassezia brasiliensis]